MLRIIRTYVRTCAFSAYLVLTSFVSLYYNVCPVSGQGGTVTLRRGCSGAGCPHDYLQDLRQTAIAIYHYVEFGISE